MTISRFSAVVLVTFAAACSRDSDRLAPQLTRVQHTNDIELAATDLQRFVESRQGHLKQLRRELTAANFHRSVSPEENDPGCELYRWANDNVRAPVVLTVDICNGLVSSSAGIPNP
jgi:hypothetical protein